MVVKTALHSTGPGVLFLELVFLKKGSFQNYFDLRAKKMTFGNSFSSSLSKLNFTLPEKF